MKQRMNIACDLDGTLAEYEGWKGIEHIGDPVPEMVDRVKKALALGHNVEIFTARVDPAHETAAEAEAFIKEWVREHVGHDLKVTAIKRGYFDEFWDDKCIRVERNTGWHDRRADETLWSVLACMEVPS